MSWPLKSKIHFRLKLKQEIFYTPKVQGESSIKKWESFNFLRPYLFICSYLSRCLSGWEIHRLQETHSFLWRHCLAFNCYNIRVWFLIDIHFEVYNTLNEKICHRPQCYDETCWRNFAVYILMLLILFCLIMITAWQEKMFEFMQKDMRRSEVSSIEVMDGKNFTFYFETQYIDIRKSPTFYTER